MQKVETIGFIGAGNMAQAIGLRLISEGYVKPSDIFVSAPSQRNLKLWSEKGVNTTNNNFEIVKKSEIIFIAVKPQYFEEAIQSLSDKNNGSKDVLEYVHFVSIMAGKTIDYISKTIKQSAKNIHNFGVTRVMPNTPCLVGSGSSVLCHGPFPGAYYEEEVNRIMTYTGTCDIIPEHLFDSVAAVSGCGPAFIYMVIESLTDGAVLCGVPRDLAMKLISQMVIGSGKMVMESGKHPGQLKDEVCSPGGTTITGVHELEKGGIRSSFMNAVTAATNKGIQLSKPAQK